MNQDKLAEVLNAVETSDGPSRKLDSMIWILIGKSANDDHDYAWRYNLPLDPNQPVNGRTMEESLKLFPNDINGITHSWNVPSFTESVDAAMSLIPKGWRVNEVREWIHNEEWFWSVSIHSEDHFKYIYVGQPTDAIKSANDRPKTLPLAICICTLRARLNRG